MTHQPYHVRTVRKPPVEVCRRFDGLISEALAAGSNAEIDYREPEPRAVFLNYLCDWKGFVAHGTPEPDLKALKPKHVPDRDVTEFGRQDYVFASPDALWAMWFALLPADKAGGTANGCKRVEHPDGRVTKRYFFSLPAEALACGPPLYPGTIYLCRGENFPERNGEEWGSPAPVVPVAKLRVGPEDFPYRDGIFGYDRQRLRDLTRHGMDGFPWCDDPDLYRIRPSRIVVDGPAGRLGSES